MRERQAEPRAAVYASPLSKLDLVRHERRAALRGWPYERSCGASVRPTTAERAQPRGSTERIMAARR